MPISNCKSFLFLILLFFVQSAIAQKGVGNYQSGFKKEGNIFHFSCSNAQVRLEFCTAAMLRVRTSWDGDFEINEPWMVVKYNWEPITIKSKEEVKQFVLETDALKVLINKVPFTIDIYSNDGQLLSSESSIANGGGIANQETVRSNKKLFPDEHFFGFGERMDFIDQRSKKLNLNVGRGIGRPHIIGAYNVLEANYCPVPFFMSTRGYGIFLHNSFSTEWDMGASDPEKYSFGAAHGELDYYFIYGPKFPAIINQYTDLTGKAPLMPLFALGLHVGTYSGGTWGHEEKTSTDYVVKLARKFREMGIPLDVLHLDSTWRIFGKNGGKGATTFEWRETFDNPKAMFDSLYALNLNLVGVHLRPRFDNGNRLNLLDQARKLGHVYPEEGNPGEFVNFFDDKAVDWWWDNGVMQVAKLGAKFLKTDEGSAFGRKANESNKTGPTGLDAQKLHNVFPIAYAKAPYEKFQAYNGIRGMNHTREGYAGIQRYPFIFAGDWPSEWQYFAPVVKAGINIGLSGVGNWAHCMGGFEHDADPELYIRWCQFGLMSSVAHLFGMDHPGYKEPWNYGEEALPIFKKYTQLRYRLIPYLYSHSYEMYQTGMPMMRALVFDYQDDENVYSIGDQYLLGSQMMVCPVTTKDAKTRVVYLPEGIWYDFHTGKKYEGEQYVQVLTPLEDIPMLVKGGAIIPMQDVVNYIGEKPMDHLSLEIYPYEASTFILYDDDGKSLEYQKGKFALTAIKCDQKDGKVLVQIDAPKGDYKVTERSYSLNIHSEHAPKSVSVNGKKLSTGWSFDADAMKLKISAGISSNRDNEILVAFK